ncbi:MAG: aminodeoxychorismate synthase component I [Crocinitomicaceae bacterium]
MKKWGNICFLNSNDGTGLLSFGIQSEFILKKGESPVLLQQYIDQNKGSYLMGSLSYELKNEFESLQSRHTDRTDYPLAHFWVPQYVIHLEKEKFAYLQGEQNEDSFAFLDYFMEEEIDHNFHRFPYQFKPRTSKERYIEQVKKLKEYIQRGDIYEVNYCQEFYAENVAIDYPLDTYFKLNQITKAPFSSFLQTNEHVVFCGSPERYLKKTGNKLISQPIKGTAPRGANPSLDEALKNQLQNDPKERAENVMIVDLVRNDLSRIAKKGSVKVSELCGIHTFETVHQMISTVECEVSSEVSFLETLNASFPMGSMTGAPKIEAMKIIDETEDFNRGIYSGSIGYISPSGDFDFNVVIRSLIYNRAQKYLSCSVGGAITILSDPEKEFEECQTKVQKILNGMYAE